MKCRYAFFLVACFCCTVYAAEDGVEESKGGRAAKKVALVETRDADSTVLVKGLIEVIRSNDAIDPEHKSIIVAGLKEAATREREGVEAFLTRTIQDDTLDPILRADIIRGLKKCMYYVFFLPSAENREAIRTIGALAQPLTAIITDEKTNDELRRAALSALKHAAGEGNQEALQTLTTITTDENTNDKLKQAAISALKNCCGRRKSGGCTRHWRPHTTPNNNRHRRGCQRLAQTGYPLSPRTCCGKRKSGGSTNSDNNHHR